MAEFEEKVKSSFEKVKENMSVFQKDLELLSGEIYNLRQELRFIKHEFDQIKQDIRQEIKTNFSHKFSSGNEGVSADQQTDRQTFNTPALPVDGKSSWTPADPAQNPTHNPTDLQQIEEKLQQMTQNLQELEQTSQEKSQESDLKDLTDLMNNLKSDLKKKFKSLTKQEFYIFSMLYTIEKSQETITYSDLALKTGLTSSSIRDYIQRIIKKGIPIIKEKLNNKVTLLKIPQELRNLSTLDNLLRIRNELKDESLDNFK